MDNRDKIIQLVNMKGPLLPAHVNKELNTNVLFAAAMLSEMVDKKIIKLSNLKVGGSPLYFSPGQEYKLQNFSDKLGDKEKQAYDILKEHFVLRDTQMEPVVRQALRLIPDFAKPIEINHNNEKMLFWKWYLITEDQLEKLIKDNLGIVEKQVVLEEENPKIEETKPLAAPELKQEIKLESNFEKQDGMEQKKKELEEKEEFLNQKEHDLKNKLKQMVEKVKSVAKSEAKPNILPEEFPLKDTGEPNDEFYKDIKKYFDKNDIVVNNYKIIRKNSDIEFDISIPSQVGELNYFCKAKNKKKCNDGDLSTVFIQGQAKKLPILFLITGAITKKAESMLNTEFKSMKIKTI